MNAFICLARPGYTLGLLALALGLGFVITGTVWGMLVVAALEAAFSAGMQYFKDRGRRLKPQS